MSAAKKPLASKAVEKAAKPEVKNNGNSKKKMT